MALTSPAKQTPQQHCLSYPGSVCTWGGDAHRWRVTYQSPTRPTCRGAFRYGYRCQGQGEAVCQGGERDRKVPVSQQGASPEGCQRCHKLGG